MAREEKCKPFCYLLYPEITPLKHHSLKAEKANMILATSLVVMKKTTNEADISCTVNFLVVQ